MDNMFVKFNNFLCLKNHAPKKFLLETQPLYLNKNFILSIYRDNCVFIHEDRTEELKWISTINTSDGESYHVVESIEEIKKILKIED